MIEADELDRDRLEFGVVIHQGLRIRCIGKYRLQELKIDLAETLAPIDAGLIGICILNRTLASRNLVKMTATDRAPCSAPLDRLGRWRMIPVGGALMLQKVPDLRVGLRTSIRNQVL